MLAALIDQFAPPHVSFAPHHQIGTGDGGFGQSAASLCPSLDEAVRPGAASQPSNDYSVEPLKHERLGVDDAAMRHLVLDARTSRAPLGRSTSEESR